MKTKHYCVIYCVRTEKNAESLNHDEQEIESICFLVFDTHRFNVIEMRMLNLK
jgi:hypothetical protein